MTVMASLMPNVVLSAAAGCCCGTVAVAVHCWDCAHHLARLTLQTTPGNRASQLHWRPCTMGMVGSAWAAHGQAHRATHNIIRAYTLLTRGCFHANDRIHMPKDP
jgi:hypothetical protein